MLHRYTVVVEKKGKDVALGNKARISNRCEQPRDVKRQQVILRELKVTEGEAAQSKK